MCLLLEKLANILLSTCNLIFDSLICRNLLQISLIIYKVGYREGELYQMNKDSLKFEISNFYDHFSIDNEDKNIMKKVSLYKMWLCLWICSFLH